MIKVTTILIKFMQKLKLFGELRDVVKVIDDGFCLTENVWPVPPRTKFTVKWDEVKEICTALYDCWSCHELVLRFYLDSNSDSPFLVYEHSDNWDLLLEEVSKQFPDFNFNNFKEAVQFLPGEGALPCWHFEKKIEDLEIDHENKKIVWKDDNSVFFEWKD